MIEMEMVGVGFEISSSHPTVIARIPGADEAIFQELASKAKAGCPVSTVLHAQMTMNATLERSARRATTG